MESDFLVYCVTFVQERERSYNWWGKLLFYISTGIKTSQTTFLDGPASEWIVFLKSIYCKPMKQQQIYALKHIVKLSF